MKLKKTYIEWLRIIAILLVIYNHSGYRGFWLFSVTEEISSKYLSLVMYPLCKAAVPIFLMISGVTLLDKDEAYKTLFCKRIFKYILVIVLFGTLQYFRYLRVGKADFTLRSWFTSIYSNPLLEIYWFLYLYLGFLFIVPFLRKVVKNMQKSDYIYLYILNLIACILAFVGFFTGIFLNGKVFQLINTLVYPLLGYGIEKYGHQINKRDYFFSCSGAILISVVGSVFYGQWYSDQLSVMENVLQQFTPVIACSIFGFVRCHSKTDISVKKENVLNVISSTVFGIFLIEDIVRKQVEKVFINLYLDSIPNDFTVGVLFTFISFAVSMGIIYILKRIPYVKKLI